MTAGRFLTAGLLSTTFLGLGTGVELGFHPEEGSSLEKEFTLEGSFELDDFSVVVDGQDFGAMLGALTLSMETETTIAVTDEYVSVSAGRPTELERTFDTIANDFSMSLVFDLGDESQDMGSESELEGSTVVFTWDDEAGEYEVAFDGQGGDEDLLEGLEEEMDLRYFLPSGEVEREDTWEVDVKELLALHAPGGNLHAMPADFDTADFDDFEILEEILGEHLLTELEELIEGTCVCTYAGTRDEDGTELAEIRVLVEIAGAADVADLLMEIMEAIGGELGEEIPVEVEVADINVDLVGEGVLLWNTAAGRLESFELVSEVQIALDFGVSVEEGGQSHFGELAVELSGSVEHRVSVDE